MKKFRLVVFLILFLGVTLSVAAQDRVKFSVAYVNTEFKLNPAEAVENLGGIQADVDGRIFSKDGFRLGGVFTYKRTYDESIAYYPETHDLVQRDTDSYSAGARLSYRVGPIEPFGGFHLGYKGYNEPGVKKQFFRRWEAGLDVPFHKESNFFVRPFFVQAELIGGLAQDPRFLYGAGAGLRF